MDYLFHAVLAAYLLGTAGYLGYVVTHRPASHKAGHCLFVAGFLCHTVLLVVDGLRMGHMPVHDLRSTLSFAAWALACVFLVFHVRFRLLVLGALVGLVVCVVMAVCLLVPGTDVDRQDLFKGFWMALHIVTVFLGQGAFVLAACVAAIYLVQERAIKAKRHGFFFRRLPSLEILDRMGYACIAFGFPMLTTGIAAGCVYAQIVWGRFWNWDPKEVWSGITWLVYAALLHERLAAGWRGRRAAVMALVGMGVLLFTFLGVNLLLKGHHEQFTKW